jgi:ribonuclease D
VICMDCSSVGRATRCSLRWQRPSLRPDAPRAAAPSVIVGCCPYAVLAWGNGSVKVPDGGVEVVQGDLPADLAAAFAKANRIAWDVETTGLDWRQDRLATCQLFAEEVGVVVVKMALSRPERLVALLEDPAVEKVFHHAPFDLRFMVHGWDFRPVSVRCTKVASKILAPDVANGAHSLQLLASRYLGVRLTKGSVRTSDWTVASLTEDQLAYAAGDVLHLLALLDVLLAELDQASLRHLYDDCCAFLPARVSLELGGYPDVFAY